MTSMVKSVVGDELMNGIERKRSYIASREEADTVE